MLFPLFTSAQKSRPAPTKISGLWAWYVVSPTYMFQDAAGTTPAGDTNPVALWRDRSGNARHLTQVTAANRPTLQLSGGQWRLMTDGVNDSLGVTGLSLPEPFTVAARFSTTTAAQTKDVWGGAGAESRLRNETGQLHSFAGTTVYNGAAFTMPTDGTKVSFTIRWNGVNTKLRKDASADVTALAAASVTSLTQFYVGNRGDTTLPWAGFHYEYLIYSRVLTDAELTTLHSYLAGRTP